MVQQKQSKALPLVQVLLFLHEFLHHVTVTTVFIFRYYKMYVALYSPEQIS